MDPFSSQVAARLRSVVACKKMCELYRPIERDTQKDREIERKDQRDEQKERGGGPHTHPHTYLSSVTSLPPRTPSPGFFLRQHRVEHLDVAGVINHGRRFVTTRLSLKGFINITSVHPIYLHDSLRVVRQTELKRRGRASLWQNAVFKAYKSRKRERF